MTAEALGSRPRIIANHRVGFNCSGMPTHLKPWRSLWVMA